MKLNQGGKFPTTLGFWKSEGKKQIEKVMLLEGFNTSEFCFGDECSLLFFLVCVFSNITPPKRGLYIYNIYN